MLTARLPEWIRMKRPAGVRDTKCVLRTYRLSTVCEEARCPNINECFSRTTAAFMILGKKCTRKCGFCSVESSPPEPVDPEEPMRIALAAREMNLRYVVITSVTRDDLADGGACQFADTVTAVKECLPEAKVEILTPDFKGDLSALNAVLSRKPDVFNHNVETVPRMYPAVRPQSDYRRSLSVLQHAKNISSGILTKSGFMLGLGERFNEIIEVMRDLRYAGCDLITIGQYLRPSRAHLPVVEYVRPEVFETLRGMALDMGFNGAASSPLVRSSMNAEEVYNSTQVPLYLTNSQGNKKKVR
jgi:lipoic acid synthetase